jgi:hypothetical protein
MATKREILTALGRVGALDDVPVWDTYNEDHQDKIVGYYGDAIWAFLHGPGKAVGPDNTVAGPADWNGPHHFPGR